MQASDPRSSRCVRSGRGPPKLLRTSYSISAAIAAAHQRPLALSEARKNRRQEWGTSRALRRYQIQRCQDDGKDGRYECGKGDELKRICRAFVHDRNPNLLEL